MNPRCGLGLAHAEQAPMQQLRGIRLEVDEDEQQPIFRSRQGTVRIGRIASRLPSPPVPGPVSQVPREGGLKGGYQRLKLFHGHARQI